MDLKEKYLTSKGMRCPFCGSNSIESGNIDWDDPLGISVCCNECNKSWTDVYTLTDVIFDEIQESPEAE